MQRLRYKFLVGQPGSQTDITNDVSSANVRYAVNEFANANITVDNKDTKWSTGSVLDPDEPIVISGSTDGSNYVRLFSGSVLSKAVSYAANEPDSMVLRCQDARLRRRSITFNNSVQDSKDFGEILIGKANSSGGYSWAADSDGNYPDGLLNETGFTHSGTVSDIYAGVPDLPETFAHGHPKLDEAINRYMDLFGVDWYTDFTSSAFNTIKRNENYPTLDFTLSIGEDINSSNLTTDGAQKIKGVLVMGSDAPYFYAKGDPPYEFIQDNELGSIEGVRERAKTELELKSTSALTGNLTVPPITESVLGQRITVDDADHGWSAVGNVISIANSITPSRWTTDLTFERPQKEAPKLMQEILDELEDIQSGREYRGLHRGYLAFSNTSSDVNTSSQAGTVCCLGIGTLSTLGGVDAQSLRILLPKADEAGKDIYFQLNEPPTLKNFNDTKPLLKEFVVYKNDTGDANQNEVWETMSRPTSGWDTAPEFIIPLSPLVKTITEVVANRLKYVSRFNGDIRAREDSPDATASIWDDVDTFTASNEQKISASWDAESKSDRYLRRVFWITTSAEKPSMMFTIDTNLSEDQKLQLTDIGQELVARVRYKRDSDGLSVNEYRMYIWNLVTGVWDLQTTASGSNQTEWLYRGLATPWPKNFIDSAGRMHFSIRPKNAQEADNSVTFEVAYWEGSVRPGQHVMQIVEAGSERDSTTMAVRRSIGELIGIFSTSDGTGLSLLVGKEYKPYWDWRGHTGAFGIIEKGGRTEDVMPQVEGNRIALRRPATWDGLRKLWKITEGSTLYVKYYPSKAIEPERQTFNEGWNLDRAINGTSNDTMSWNLTSASGEETLQNKPAYKSEYTISYVAFDDAVAYTRLTMSTGLDKNPNKSLTVHFYDTNATTSDPGGGDPGGGGGSDGKIIAI